MTSLYYNELNDIVKEIRNQSDDIIIDVFWRPKKLEMNHNEEMLKLEHKIPNVMKIEPNHQLDSVKEIGFEDGFNIGILFQLIVC